MKLLLFVWFSTIAFVAHGGPEAIDEKWEACNAKQDGGLASLGNNLNSSDYYDLKGADPCTKCRVWNLGTVKRTSDTQFMKNVDGGVIHKMKLGFGSLRILCNCSKDLGVKKLDGQMAAIWTEPRFTIELLVKHAVNVAAFTGSKVDSRMAETCATECQGDNDWKGECGKMQKMNLFDVSIKSSIENLFPTQSTTSIQNDKQLIDSLYCGE